MYSAARRPPRVAGARPSSRSELRKRRWPSISAVVTRGARLGRHEGRSDEQHNGQTASAGSASARYAIGRTVVSTLRSWRAARLDRARSRRHHSSAVDGSHVVTPIYPAPELRHARSFPYASRSPSHSASRRSRIASPARAQATRPHSLPHPPPRRPARPPRRRTATPAPAGPTMEAAAVGVRHAPVTTDAATARARRLRPAGRAHGRGRRGRAGRADHRRRRGCGDRRGRRRRRRSSVCISTFSRPPRVRQRGERAARRVRRVRPAVVTRDSALIARAARSHTESYVSKRIALVLGGGGLKGFAHIGVLRALAERERSCPTCYAGTSIGALIAAAHLGGTPVELLAERAQALRRKDLFRLNHFGMLLDRMRAPSIYLEEPLRELVAGSHPGHHLRRAAEAAARELGGPRPGRACRLGAARPAGRLRARRGVRVVRAAGLLPARPRGRSHLHRRRRGRQPAGVDGLALRRHHHRRGRGQLRRVADARAPRARGSRRSTCARPR